MYLLRSANFPRPWPAGALGILQSMDPTKSAQAKRRRRGQKGNPGQFAPEPSQQATAASIHSVDLTEQNSALDGFGESLLASAAEVDMRTVLGGENWKGMFSRMDNSAERHIRLRLEGYQAEADEELNDLAHSAAWTLANAVKALAGVGEVWNGPRDAEENLGDAFKLAARYGGSKVGLFAEEMEEPASPWQGANTDEWEPPHLDEERIAGFDLSEVLDHEQIGVGHFDSWDAFNDRFNLVAAAERAERASQPRRYGTEPVSDAWVCAEMLRDCIAILSHKPYDDAAAVNVRLTMVGAVKSALMATAEPRFSSDR